MTEKSYNLKYTGKEIDALLDKANDLDDSAQVPAGGTSGQVLTKKSGTDFDAQWETPGVALPTGGAAEQILTKNSSTDGDASWKDAPIALPDGGTSGQVLTKNSSTDGDASWKTPETPSNPLPTGGTAGQVLAKKTDTNYDAEWIDAHSGDSNVVIAIIDKNGSLNKTYDELLAAVNANKVVFIKDLSDSYDSYYSYQYIHSTYGLLFIITGARIYTNGTYIKINTPYIGVKNDNTFVHGRSFNGGLVPEGGTTGQVLAKSSNNSYEVTWVSQTGGSGGGGSSDSNIVVALCQKDSSGTVSLSMTYDEILSAISANKVVIVKDTTGGISSKCTAYTYQYTDSTYGLMFMGAPISYSSNITLPFIGLKSDGTLTTDRVYRNGTFSTGGNYGYILAKSSGASTYTTMWKKEQIASHGYLWHNEKITYVNSMASYSGETVSVSSSAASVPVISYVEKRRISSDISGWKTLMIPSWGWDSCDLKMEASDGGYRTVHYDDDLHKITFGDGVNSQGQTDNTVCIPMFITATVTN